MWTQKKIFLLFKSLDIVLNFRLQSFPLLLKEKPTLETHLCVQTVQNPSTTRRPTQIPRTTRSVVPPNPTEERSSKVKFLLSVRSAHISRVCLGGVHQQQSKATTTAAAAAGGEGAEGPARGQIHQDAHSAIRCDCGRTLTRSPVKSHSLRGTHHTHQITMILGLRQHFLLDTEGLSLLALHPAKAPPQSKKKRGRRAQGKCDVIRTTDGPTDHHPSLRQPRQQPLVAPLQRESLPLLFYILSLSRVDSRRRRLPPMKRRKGPRAPDSLFLFLCWLVEIFILNAPSSRTQELFCSLARTYCNHANWMKEGSF
jgi:hypothetical protein